MEWLTKGLDSILRVPSRLEKKYPNHIGYFYNVLSQFFYALFEFMIRETKSVPSFQLAWFRSSFLMFSAYLVFVIKKTSVPIKTPKVNLILILRGMTGFISNALLFYGFQLAPLSEGIVVMETYPSMAALLSVLFLKERYSFTQFLYTIFSLTGAVLIIKPGFIFSPDTQAGYDAGRFIGIVSIFFSAVTVALSVVLVRAQAISKVDTITGMFYTGFIQMLFFPVSMIFQGAKVVTLAEFGNMMLLGLFGMVAQYLFNHSLHFGDAGKISLVAYTEMVFGYILDTLIIGTKPEFYSMIGSTMIFSCVFIQMYELAKKPISNK